MESNVAMPNQDSPSYVAYMICRECGYEAGKESSFTRQSLPHLCPDCGQYALRPQLAHWPEAR